jgi:hypothetical protein
MAALSRLGSALLVGAALVVALSGCSGEQPAPASTEPVVTTPQASIAGEWVVTRTVTASDDPAPSRAVGAVSTRLVLIEQEDCETAICAGTVSSGVTVDDRETTALEQTDGGLGWTYVGLLDCLKAGTTTVQVPDAFEYSQVTTLTVGESADVEAAPTANTLNGTMTLTGTVADDAADFGCTRVPASTTVEYMITAVRATPVAVP